VDSPLKKVERNIIYIYVGKKIPSIFGYEKDRSLQLVSEHRFKCNDIRILINVDIIINFINWHGKLW
jgi:hypothetical protein